MNKHIEDVHNSVGSNPKRQLKNAKRQLSRKNKVLSRYIDENYKDKLKINSWI